MRQPEIFHHHHPHRLGKKAKLSLSQELGSWGMEGKGEKNLDLARKSGQEGAAVTYKSVAVMEGR